MTDNNSELLVWPVFDIEEDPEHYWFETAYPDLDDIELIIEARIDPTTIGVLDFNVIVIAETGDDIFLEEVN